MVFILSSVSWPFLLEYLNDIVIFSKSPQDHVEQMRHVLRIQYKTGFTLKLKSCKSLPETIDYSSHVIQSGRPELTDHTADEVTKL